MPVYGSFDHSIQTGLLVLTCPWDKVRAMLASPKVAMVLRNENERGDVWRNAPLRIAQRLA